MQRQLQIEQMDQPDLDPGLHKQALRGLARLNRFTGVASDMYRQIRSIARHGSGGPIKLLDIASGSGDLPIAWAVRAKRDGIDLDITTVDISTVAIEEQTRRAHDAGVTLHSIGCDCIKDELPSGYDICTNSLFLHHLSQMDAIALIRKMVVSARHVVLCDLERSRINRLQVMIASRLVTRSKVVHYDAKCSVEGAFSQHEFGKLMHEACGERIAIRRLVPCRMIATIHRKQIQCKT